MPPWSHHSILRSDETWLPEWSGNLGGVHGNAPKWFAAVEMIRLAADQEWLHKATKEISKYWRHKRERCQTHLPSSRPTQRQVIKFQAEKVSSDGQF
jgi:hypothetical protein